MSSSHHGGTAPAVPPAGVTPPAVVTPPPEPDHGHVQKFCTYLPGEKPWQYLGGSGWRYLPIVGLWATAIVSVGLVSSRETAPYAPWAWGVGAIALVWALIVFGAKTFLVPKNCYALKSSGEVTSPETFGPGLRSQQFGDEPIVIRINPITVKWSVPGVKLKDNFVVDLEGQATVSPDPRIAGDNDINTYGAWILEGLSEGDDTRGVHNVEHGIQGGITSLVITVLNETNSVDFDKSPLGFQLLLEADLACHEAPHHNTDFCDEVGGGPTNGVGSILGWYQGHHVAIRKWLDEHAGHFAVAYNEPLKVEMISHQEGHVGSSHDHTIVTKRSYTPDSLKLKQIEMSATEKGKGTEAEAKAKANVTAIDAEANAKATIVKAEAEAEGGRLALEKISPAIAKAVAELTATGVRPDVALASVMKQAGREPGFNPQVFVGDRPSGGRGGPANQAANAAVTGVGLATGINTVNNPPATPSAGGNGP